jgi:large-conductance mechanosensitive channel
MEQSITPTPAVESKSNVLIQFGAMSAGISLLIFVILYIGGTDFFKSPVAILSYCVPIILGILACRKAKKENGGYLAFKEALKISFGIWVITTLVTTLVSFVLFNYIDPGFADAMKQMTLEQTQKMLANFGVPQDQIDKTISEMINMDLYSLGNLMKSFLQFCIVGFILSLIIAAIMKKSKPEFAD